MAGDSIPTVAIARVAGAVFAGEAVIHLRVQGAFRAPFFKESGKLP